MQYDGPKFVSRKDVAKLANCSVPSVDRYSRRPDFPLALDFGGKKMWAGVEVWAWIMSRRRERR